MRKLLLFVVILFACTNVHAKGAPDYLPDGAHPRIWLTPPEITKLIADRDSGSAKWAALVSWCDEHIADSGYNVQPLNQVNQDLTNWHRDNNYTGYRMSGYATHIYNYSLGYQILKQAGSAQDIAKANTYAARAKTIIIDGISRSLSVGEETGNGLHAIRVAALTDETMNSAEAALTGRKHRQSKLGYSARSLMSVPIAYDWIYDTLTSGEKTEIRNMLLGWADWCRGKRSSYNNGVLINGVRYYEDTDGSCTGTNNCVGVPVAQKGYAYENAASNFGTSIAALVGLTSVATYGDYPEDVAYHNAFKAHLRDNMIVPLANDLMQSGGDSIEGWSYGSGFEFLIQGLYGYYTATENPMVSDMAWTKELIRAMAHRTAGDKLTVPLWGHWSGLPVGENRIGIATKFTGIEQKLHPTSNESKWGQHILDTSPFTTALEPWESLIFLGNGVTASTPVTLNEPLSYVAQGNGLYNSRSSWTDPKTVQVLARLEGKVSAVDHEGYDEGTISIHRGGDELLAHQNYSNGTPPSIYFNTVVFNKGNHTAKFVPTTPSPDRFIENQTFSYVSGDIKGAWWNLWGENLADGFRRSVLHIRPNIVVVADVTKSNATRENLKEWFSQYANDPTISGKTITVNKGTSKAFVTTLYPEGSYTKSNPAPGYYRVVLTPTVSQQYEQFVHAIQVGDSAATQLPTTLITGTNCRGTKVGNNVAIFTSAPSGSNISSASYTANATTHYVADLQPLTEYTITSTGANTLNTAKTTTSAGILTFDTPNAGNTTVTLSGGAELPPTCTDGVKNGTETDVDCGGTCPPCAVPPSCPSTPAICTQAQCTANNLNWCNGVCQVSACGTPEIPVGSPLWIFKLGNQTMKVVQ